MYLWLIAAGLTIVFGVLRILNFAHGVFYMLGGYATFTLYGMLGLNFWLSLVLSLISVALLGGLIERLFLRQVYNLELPYQLILTYAFILIFDDLAKMIWGPMFKIPPVPSALSGTVSVLGRAFPVYNLFIIGTGIAVAIGLWLILGRTWWGKTIRAAVSEREMASALGINIPMLFLTVFMFGTAVAALGGALSVPTRVVTPGVGMLMIVEAFVVTVIGGLGNLKGAFIGALIVGMLTSYGIMFIPILQLFTMYAIMAIVLLIRPQGIFGR